MSTFVSCQHNYQLSPVIIVCAIQSVVIQDISVPITPSVLFLTYSFATEHGECHYTRAAFEIHQGFCRSISPFYSICLCNKNAEAVKFLENYKKKSFPSTKTDIFCKKKYFFHKKNLFYKTQIIHVYLYSLSIPSFPIFLTHYSSALNKSSFLLFLKLLCIERGY